MAQNGDKADSVDSQTTGAHAEARHDEKEQNVHRPTPFAHSFWAPEVAPQRAIFMKAMTAMVVLLIITMWICMPVYWGSLANQRSYPHKLKSYLINRDQSDVGNAIQQAIEANMNLKTKLRLGWDVRDPSQYLTDVDVQHAVLEERAWLAVVIAANATSKLRTARENGDNSYNGSTVVQVYYSQARNEQAAGNFLVPLSQALLSQAIAQFNTQYAGTYLEAQARNATAMSALAQAPQTIAEPVGYTMNNMRPFSAPVATALLLVGSIYIIIFAFVITMSGYAVRQPMEPFLTLPSLVKLRLIAPLALYIPLSFSFSMISLAFKVPFGARFGYGGGFFLYWVFVYCTMAALGLATEMFISILTPKFMTFFLFPLIISNVSVASLPITLEPWFYKYGYAFPVFNMGQATRAIIFDTKNHLGLNIGILLAWIALSFCTISLVTTVLHKRARNQAKQQGKGADEAELDA